MDFHPGEKLNILNHDAPKVGVEIKLSTTFLIKVMCSKFCFFMCSTICSSFVAVAYNKLLLKEQVFNLCHYDSDSSHAPLVIRGKVEKSRFPQLSLLLTELYQVYQVFVCMCEYV